MLGSRPVPKKIALKKNGVNPKKVMAGFPISIISDEKLPISRGSNCP
jgi:hypothetical protein